jgi:hypothetical protein
VAQTRVRWASKNAASSASLIRIWPRRSMPAVYGRDAGSLTRSLVQ